MNPNPEINIPVVLIEKKFDSFPFDLLERYKDSDIRREFNSFKYKLNFFSEKNKEFGLKMGDIILFKNGYDIEMISEILGFDEEGRAYMFWDCFWFSIDLKTRLISKIS